jgi:hypothetical protein
MDAIDKAESYKPVATVPSSSGSSITVAAESEGFEGLELGFGSFPIITLKDDSFRISGEKNSEVDGGFDVVLMGSKEKHLYRATNPENTKDDALIEYSYDQVTTLGGDSVESVLAEWDRKHLSVTVKKYVEVTAQMVGGELDGQFFLLSISPASRSRLAGFYVEVKMREKRKLNEVVTRCSMGPKIGSGSTAFYPWDFKVNRELTESYFS